MNLDTMRTEWMAHDKSLETSIRLNTKLLREIIVEKQRSKVQFISLFGFLVELPFYILTIGWLSKFIVNHVQEFRFLIPALAIDIWCIFMISAVIRQFASLQHLNLDDPILALQKKLNIIKRFRVRSFQWGFLTGLFVWYVPFLIVLCKGFFNVDLYSIMPIIPTMLLLNLVISLALIPITLWIAKRNSSRFQHSWLIQKLVDGIAGQDIAAANVALEKLSRFESDSAAT